MLLPRSGKFIIPVRRTQIVFYSKGACQSWFHACQSCPGHVKPVKNAPNWIIFFSSTLIAANSAGLHPNSDALQPKSDGLLPTSDGLQMKEAFYLTASTPSDPFTTIHNGDHC